MLRILFFVCTFALSWDVSSTKPKDYLHWYLDMSASARFGRQLLQKNVFDKELIETNTIESASRYANMCGTALTASLKSSEELNRVFEVIDIDNVPLYPSNPKERTDVLRCLNEMSGDIEIAENIRKLVLLAPESPSVPLELWLAKCDSLCKGKDNYELSSFDENYPIERALYILFTGVDFGFLGLFVSKENRRKYVKYTCGALRTYLYHVYGVSINQFAANPQRSYILILKQCYDFLKDKIDKNPPSV